MAGNRKAATATVKRLKASGALDEVDEALVQAFLALASAVDDHPEKGDLWREYRAISQALREAAGGSDDDAASFLVSVQTYGRAKVVDAEES